jgi:hypothetical protein
MIRIYLSGRDKQLVQSRAVEVGVSYQHFINRLVNMYEVNFASDVEWMAELLQSDDEDERQIVDETRPQEERLSIEAA